MFYDACIHTDVSSIIEMHEDNDYCWRRRIEEWLFANSFYTKNIM
jgi:hypothetical protein